MVTTHCLAVECAGCRRPELAHTVTGMRLAGRKSPARVLADRNWRSHVTHTRNPPLPGFRQTKTAADWERHACVVQQGWYTSSSYSAPSVPSTASWKRRIFEVKLHYCKVRNEEWVWSRERKSATTTVHSLGPLTFHMHICTLPTHICTLFNKTALFPPSKIQLWFRQVKVFLTGMRSCTM